MKKILRGKGVDVSAFWFMIVLWIIIILMNIKHVKSGTIWPKLALGSYAVSLGVGLYGNSRTKFSSDFIYNVTLPMIIIFRNTILEFY